jgi:hypothetical protein
MADALMNTDKDGFAWMVVDGYTGCQVGRPRKSRKRAQAYADKLDLAYGAYRYRVEPIALGGGY